MDQEGLADEEVSDKHTPAAAASSMFSSKKREFILKRPEVAFTLCQSVAKVF